MSPITKSALASAKRRLDMAIVLLEEAADSGHVALLGDAYACVLLARGEFAAVFQLMQLEDMLERTDEARPEHLPPRLMLVRK